MILDEQKQFIINLNEIKIALNIEPTIKFFQPQHGACETNVGFQVKSCIWSSTKRRFEKTARKYGSDR